MDLQWSTVEIWWLPGTTVTPIVVHSWLHRPMKNPQWSTAKHWMSLGDIIYMAQLTTVETRGIILVNCMEWNAIGIGDYCYTHLDRELTTEDKWRIHSGQLEENQCHWWLLYTYPNIQLTTLEPRWIQSGLLQRSEHHWRLLWISDLSQWSTACLWWQLAPSSRNTVDYCRPKDEYQWSTAENLISLGTTVKTKRDHSGQL